MGQYAFDCGLFAPLQGNNGDALCTHFFNVNGCTITYIGPRGPAPQSAILNPGTWLTGSSTSVKGCPKASAYTNLAFSSVPNTPASEVRLQEGAHAWNVCLALLVA